MFSAERLPGLSAALSCVLLSGDFRRNIILMQIAMDVVVVLLIWLPGGGCNAQDRRGAFAPLE